MNFEVKTYKYICDKCKKEAVVHAMYNILPIGWTTEEVGPCGLTDYYRDEDICTSCNNQKAQS